LNSESKLKFPVTFKPGESREVELVYGEAYFDVSSSKNHQGALLT
jgi:ferric-dicitrate binding protein FerR (iron transport regulator)